MDLLVRGMNVTFSECEFQEKESVSSRTGGRRQEHDRTLKIRRPKQPCTAPSHNAKMVAKVISRYPPDLAFVSVTANAAISGKSYGNISIVVSQWHIKKM